MGGGHHFTVAYTARPALVCFRTGEFVLRIGGGKARHENARQGAGVGGAVMDVDVGVSQEGEARGLGPIPGTGGKALRDAAHGLVVVNGIWRRTSHHFEGRE
jgi:hypothetical protein